MIENLFQTYLQQYILYQKDQLSLLEQFTSEAWNKLTIDCGQISKDWFALKSDELRQAGVNRNNAVLYYFELPQPEMAIQIVEIVRELKLNQLEKLSLPKINKPGDLPGYSILYLGKSQKNFQERFKQHCGLSSSSTFSLHLVKWPKHLGLQLNLHFTVLPTEASKTLQTHLESMMHFCMKPLLGREGTMH